MSKPEVHSPFPAAWNAEALTVPPLIAPARSYVWPFTVSGEEEALARGAVRVMVRPHDAPAFLATCALGYADASMPSGVWSCPSPREVCVLAGGYAYIAGVDAPERPFHLPVRPVVRVCAAAEYGLLLFAGFHTVLAWGQNGMEWETERLSWEGVTLGGVAGHTLHGAGWDMLRDAEVPFEVDLRSGRHTGGSAPGQHR